MRLVLLKCTWGFQPREIRIPRDTPEQSGCFFPPTAGISRLWVDMTWYHDSFKAPEFRVVCTVNHSVQLEFCPESPSQKVTSELPILMYDWLKCKAEKEKPIDFPILILSEAKANWTALPGSFFFRGKNSQSPTSPTKIACPHSKNPPVVGWCVDDSWDPVKFLGQRFYDRGVESQSGEGTSTGFSY